MKKKNVKRTKSVVRKPSRPSASKPKKRKSRPAATRASAPLQAVSARNFGHHRIIGHSRVAAHSNSTAPPAYSGKEPFRVITMRSGAHTTFTVAAGNRALVAVTPGGRTLIAGFQCKQTNGIWSDLGIFPSTGDNDQGWMRSNILTSTDNSPTWSFKGANSTYAADTSPSKAVYSVVPASLHSEDASIGVQPYLNTAQDSLCSKVTMDSALLKMRIAPTYTASASVHAVSTDDLDLPSQTARLMRNTTGAVMAESSGFVARRLPGSPGTQTLQSAMDAVIPHLVPGNSIRHIDQIIKPVYPFWWSAGQASAIGADDAASVDDFNHGRYPNGNPFMGMMLTGQYIFINASGGDVVVDVAVQAIHHYEMLFTLGAVAADTGLRGMLLDKSSHVASNSMAIRASSDLKFGKTSTGVDSSTSANNLAITSGASLGGVKSGIPGALSTSTSPLHPPVVPPTEKEKSYDEQHPVLSEMSSIGSMLRGAVHGIRGMAHDAFAIRDEFFGRSQLSRRMQDMRISPAGSSGRLAIAHRPLVEEVE